jgi:hypothetical protein
VIDDLRTALETGQSNPDLNAFISTHTYKLPQDTSTYRSYGRYYSPDMVKDGQSTSVPLLLGVETSTSRSEVIFSKVDNCITLNQPCLHAEIVIQLRIGETMMTSVLSLSSDQTDIKHIYLGDERIELTSDHDVPDQASFRCTILKLYDTTSRSPIWASTDNMVYNLSAPSYMLTSEYGEIGAPSLEIRTAHRVLPTMIESPLLSTSYLYFGDQAVRIGPVSNKQVYIEYIVQQIS